MVVSLGLECWAVTHDLPYPGVDEPVFVRPAVHMASTGDLDPHWFGHPGSTTIYPLAGIYHAWDAVAHGGPVFSSDPGLAHRFATDPGTFYLLGRLWSTDQIVVVINKYPYSNGHILVSPIAHKAELEDLTDSEVAAMQKESVAVVRLLKRASTRDQILAGAAIGVGISTRYFLLTLVAALVAAGIIALRRGVPGASVRGIAAGVGIAVAAFVLTTPYFLLDWSAARASLIRENGSHVGHDGLSRLGNLRWYLGNSIPNTISWPVALLAVTGIVLAVAYRRDPRRLVLLVGSASFVAAISISSSNS